MKKFDVILGNPPFGSDKRHIDKESFGLGKAFMYGMIDWTHDNSYIATVLPYGAKTYNPAAQEYYKKKGLYHIADARGAFGIIFAQTSVFYFDRSKKNLRVVDELMGEFEIPTSNMSSFYKGVTGVGREYLHLLSKEEGKYPVLVTTKDIRYTDDEDVLSELNDRTRGKWRVVMNHIAGQGTLGRLVVVPPERVLMRPCDTLTCHSEEHANAVKEYLETEEVKELISKVKISLSNSAKVLRYIPRPSHI